MEEKELKMSYFRGNHASFPSTRFRSGEEDREKENGGSEEALTEVEAIWIFV